MGIISHLLTKPNNAFKMIIFEDVFTGNEVFSDAYPCKLIDDFVWVAEGMVITIDNSIDESAIGGNASAEDAADDTEDVKETAINLVYAFKLKPYDIDKKQYTKYIKDYGKKLSTSSKPPERATKISTLSKPKWPKSAGRLSKISKISTFTSTKTITKMACFPSSITARTVLLPISPTLPPASMASNVDGDLWTLILQPFPENGSGYPGFGLGFNPAFLCHCIMNTICVTV